MDAASNGHRGGYQLPEDTALLTFEGGKYAGAEVRVFIGLPLGYYLELLGKLSQSIQKTIPEFGDRILVDWNLLYSARLHGAELDGQPIPANASGMEAMPLSFSIEIINAWMDAVRGVPADGEEASPLVETSTVGNMSAVALTEMVIP